MHLVNEIMHNKKHTQTKMHSMNNDLQYCLGATPIEGLLGKWFEGMGNSPSLYLLAIFGFVCAVHTTVVWLMPSAGV